jgi:hypothetical protein
MTFVAVPIRRHGCFVCKRLVTKTLYMQRRRKSNETNRAQGIFYSLDPRRPAAETVQRLRTIFLCAGTRMSKFRVT